MWVAVLFHDTPVAGQSEVTDVIEDAQCFILILKNKPPLFQYVYLFSEGDGLFCIFHIKRNVPPWSAGLATRSVVGFVAAKVLLLFETAKHFDGKFYYRGEKAGKDANYPHARVVSDKFCIVSDLDLREKLCTFAVELRQ